MGVRTWMAGVEDGGYKRAVGEQEHGWLAGGRGGTIVGQGVEQWFSTFFFSFVPKHFFGVSFLLYQTHFVLQMCRTRL